MRSTTTKQWLVLYAGLLAAVASYGGGSAETPPAPPPESAGSSRLAYPLSVTDDQGTAVLLPRKPVRIVSVTLFTDEILVDLVDASSLVAVTSFAVDPDISNVSARVAGVPNKIALAVEPVLALTPDLVFVSTWSEADKVKQLRGAGVAVYVVGSGANVAEVQERIRAVARAVGEPERGEKMVAAMDARLAGVASKVSALPAEKRLRVVDYATWGSAQGHGSSWDEIVRLAGLTNAVGSMQADQYGQVPLSKEKLLELDPDLLILPGWVYGDPKGAEAFFKQTIEDPALAGMKAVRQKRAYQMPERLKSTVSQYLAEAVEHLARAAYPELFR